jgi:hypothetical protein
MEERGDLVDGEKAIVVVHPAILEADPVARVSMAWRQHTAVRPR